jgi:dCTP deaminase
MGVLTDWQIERDVVITPFSPAQKRDGQISWGCSSYGYDVRLGYKFRVFNPYPPGGAAHVIDPKNFDPKMLVEVDLTPSTHKWSSLGVCEKCKTCVGDNPPPDCEFVPDHIIIPPHSFVLGESVEEFRFPRDINCLVVGKSTYARCGLIVNVTPGEPDWQGRWTIELSNTTPLPMKVYAGEGIMQCVFLRSDARDELAIAAIADYLDVPNPPVQEGWAPPTKEEAANYLRQLVLREGPIFKEATCHQSYADKKGKYQNQGGLTLPEVDKVAPTPQGGAHNYGSDVPPEAERGIRNFVMEEVKPNYETIKQMAVRVSEEIERKTLGDIIIDASGFAWFTGDGYTPGKPMTAMSSLTPGSGYDAPTPPAPDPVKPAPAPTPAPEPAPDGANLPPANATGDFWKSPRGSIWRRRSPDHPWVEVSGPAPKTRSDIR